MSRITRTERVQAFLFLLIGVVVTASVVLTLAGLRFTQNRIVYYLRFKETVSGLQPGAPVRYKGVKYGKVGEIKVEPEDPELIRVTLQLDADAPIRVSTEAVIATETILGPYHIELRGSRATSPTLPPGSYIPASATTLAKLLATGETLGDQLVKVLRNLEKWTNPEHERSFWSTVSELNRSLATARVAIKRLEPEVLHLVRTYDVLGTDAIAFLKENGPVAQRLLRDLEESGRRIRTLLEQGTVEELADAAKLALQRAVTEFERDGAAVRAWLARNDVAPQVERAVKALERVEKGLLLAASSVADEGTLLARQQIAPALRDL
ncbi:MAG: hypothetical protein CMJ83_16970, partial [Planctomycetes bacterium]|nr:hypothetical protein [Planctomycetota bacterium]